jgi:hypothetical protein
MPPPHGITLFSWAPGDSIVVTIPPEADSSMAVAQQDAQNLGEDQAWKLGEVRMHRPWGLWRYVFTSSCTLSTRYRSNADGFPDSCRYSA